MSEWAQTHRQPARVLFPEGHAIEGDLHLQPNSVHHQGVETPLEMLNRPEDFFAVTLPNGDVALIAKAQTAVVECDQCDSEVDPPLGRFEISVRLEVRLASGTEVSGCARWELPPASARSIDFLNSRERFFTLADNGTIRYINRSLVQEVHPCD